MGREVKIDMSGQSNDCLWVCNVKMKKNLLEPKRGTLLRIFSFRGLSVKRFESFLTRSQVTISLTLLWTHFGQYQLDLDGAHGYIHGPYTTACICTNTAWNLPKKLLGILYHKLSIIMLIRRGAVCFKAYF